MKWYLRSSNVRARLPEPKLLWIFQEAWGYYMLLANQVITAGMDGVVLGINQLAIHRFLEMMEVDGLRYQDLFFKIVSIDNIASAIRHQQREAEENQRKIKQGSGGQEPKMTFKRV